MRELDLLTLEELMMMRRAVQPTTTAAPLQVASMLLILLGVVAVLAHSLRQPAATASAERLVGPGSEVSLTMPVP